MSISLMTEAFKTELPPTLKLVLIALCDNANDEGECFPSVPTLMKKTSLSERAVRNCISKLKTNEFLSVFERKGRSNVYRINLHEMHPCTKCTPAPDAPHPCTKCTPPLHDVHPTPAPRAPITINNHKTKHQRNHQSAKAPEWLPEQLWNDFVAMRKAIKKPMTDRAQQLMLSKLENLKNHGHNIVELLETSIRNSWQDVYPPKPERPSQPNKTKSLYEQNMEAAKRAEALIFGDNHATS